MTTDTDGRKLTLDDIADLRAYEREREAFRDHVIALKKRRRIGVGPHVTLVFENRDTIRFQIQEMARAEKILSDEGIETELRIYNPLIPEPGTLSATLFVELTSDEELREWLPKLVGIERSVVLRIGEAGDAVEVRCVVDEDHEAQLTREDVTASVHYVRFELGPELVEAFASRPVVLAIDHPSYGHEAPLGDERRAELLGDLRA
jgi:hypothetical protein